MYSFIHSFVNPLLILLNIFSLDMYFHSVCLVCRHQTRQTLTISTLEIKGMIYIYMKILFNIKFNLYNTWNWVSKTFTKLPVLSHVLYSNI